jgi:hypothetical protein
MHGYHARAFDSALVTHIERDVLRTTSNDIILVIFQQMGNIYIFFVILVATTIFNITSY